MSQSPFRIRHGALLAPQASDPSPAEDGMMYYNTVSDVFRGYINGSWQNINSGAGALNYQFIAETPSGLVNSSNTIFNATYTPAATNGYIVIINGLVQRLTTDFTVSGTQITFTTAPTSGSNVLVCYGTNSKMAQKNAGSGDSSTTAFKLFHGDDSMVFVDGLVSNPGIDHKLSSNYAEFFTAPGTGQAIYSVAKGLGNFVQEVPSGTVNGSNVTFTLATTPSSAGAVMVFLDGVLVEQGSGAGKYTISGTTITFGTAPVAPQVVYAIVFNL